VTPAFGAAYATAALNRLDWPRTIGRPPQPFAETASEIGHRAEDERDFHYVLRVCQSPKRPPAENDRSLVRDLRRRPPACSRRDKPRLVTADRGARWTRGGGVASTAAVIHSHR